MARRPGPSVLVSLHSALGCFVSAERVQTSMQAITVCEPAGSFDSLEEEGQD